MGLLGRAGPSVLRACSGTSIFEASALLRSRPLHVSASLKAKESSPIFNVQDEDDFQTRVLESSVPVIVDFHAKWCGPCKILMPRLETIVSSKKGEVVMAKVDIDALDGLASQYKVRSIPHVLAMKNGKVVDQFTGVLDDDKISAVVDKLLDN
ncbi:hypothetical protein RvY_05921 [Ramazzottius varieornatus]|uniref:Thioredoxin domain-containing protein n=1 Tax=Ramazzottius varieornatus TaxID=947166 RepID=A0A1D1V3A9_RAMVA|nr:hypothetical protein RvY_05921 [Ramazzottius varieornatus]